MHLLGLCVAVALHGHVRGYYGHALSEDPLDEGRQVLRQVPWMADDVKEVPHEVEGVGDCDPPLDVPSELRKEGVEHSDALYRRGEGADVVA